MTLVFALIQVVDAKEVFYNSMDSLEAMEASGGEILSRTVEDAKVDKAIYTNGEADGVRFPAEGN